MLEAFRVDLWDDHGLNGLHHFQGISWNPCLSAAGTDQVVNLISSSYSVSFLRSMLN